MPDERIISIKVFRELLKEQGFASNAISDIEAENDIILLDGLAQIYIRTVKRAENLETC